MAVKKNNPGFLQFGRTMPGLEIPQFNSGLKWRGADLQTMKNVILGPANSLDPDYERVSFDLGAGKSLAAAFHPSSRSDILPLIIIIHGMAGDEQSPNVISSAAYFSAQGFPVLRLNLRGAGPSAKTSVGPYHGGLSADLARVIDQLATRNYGAGIVLYGISLGGNMMLKYLGDRGANARVKAAVAVSAPLNLKTVQVRIMASRNRLYHNYLLLGMKNYMKQSREDHDQSLLDRAQAAKSLFEFDDQVTAPANGIAGAEDYYRLHSAGGFVDQITVPTLLIHAENDPWIPVADYHSREWPAEGPISLLIANDGGHVGFHAKDHKVPWQERVAAQYFENMVSERG